MDGDYVEKKYDIRIDAFGLALLKQELSGIRNVLKDGSIDWLQTGQLVEEATKRALVYVHSMLETMAREHPEWEDPKDCDGPNL
jgi:hypothetical protein